MSDTAFDVASWDAFDRGRQIRLAAIAVLQAAPTPAGARVFDTPLDPFQIEDLPAIGIMADETRETVAAAGGAPGFRVRMTMMVQCQGIAALPADLVALMDAFRSAVLEALLADPVWPGMFEPIASVEEFRRYGTPGERMLGDITLKFALSWQERFQPRADSALLQGGQPIGIIHRQREVIGPLETMIVTQEPDGHPQPGTIEPGSPAPGTPLPTLTIPLPQ